MQVYNRLRIGNIATSCFQFDLGGFQNVRKNTPIVLAIDPWPDNKIHTAIAEVIDENF